jgi:hypothetical protein
MLLTVLDYKYCPAEGDIHCLIKKLTEKEYLRVNALPDLG